MTSLLLLTTSLLVQTLPSADAMARLHKGEVVVRTEGNFTVAQVVVNAPPAVVWRLIADCANYSKEMPRVLQSSASHVNVGPNFGSGTMVCSVTTDLPWPLADLTSVSKVFLKVEPEKNLWVREWKLLEGDYEYQEGSWTLLAIDGGEKTLATYRITLKPKVALPESILQAAQNRAVPDMMRGLRSRKWQQ